MVELVSPAGDVDCLRAAVANGADAVYFGLRGRLNARARAANIAIEDLRELMAWLRRQQVKGYVALNTLVFPEELPAVEELVRRIALAGADAAIVQDLGVARLVRAVCPDLPVHASTQMTLSSAENLAAVAGLGITRAVLPRELTIAQVDEIHRQTSIELEVFVHGALCIAYGGQCLASLAMGGRSANRGQCAQACRLPYELVAGDKDMQPSGRKYLFSPQDLAAHDLLGEIVAAGAVALKIEGRLKTSEYVATVTRHYRHALDEVLAGRRTALRPEQVEEMELAFSRGFSTGWLRGPSHRTLVPGSGSANRGILLGRVKAVRGDRLVVALRRPVRRGDGVVLASRAGAKEAQGGRVYEIFRDGESLETSGPGVAELAFARHQLDLRQVRPGQEVWKTDDPRAGRQLRKTFQQQGPLRRVALDVVVEARVGRPLVISGQASTGAACRVQSPEALVPAVKHPLTAELLREQLGRLGKTHYELRGLEARMTGEPMVPLSVLGKLRRDMVSQLEAAEPRGPVRQLAAGPVLPALLPNNPRELGRGNSPTVHVLCRGLEQVRAVLQAGVRSVVAEFEDVDLYPEAIEAARSHAAQISLATPRIQKPGEAHLLDRLRQFSPDGLVVRHLAGAVFSAAASLPFVADFSLNAANPLSVAYLREMGARRVTVSYDLDRRQVHALASSVPGTWLEVVVHRHTPLFHTEHCVFCARLSQGTDRSNCGHPCRRRDVRIRDRRGAEHVLRADACCRNTLYHAEAQSMLEAVPGLIEQGVRDFRVELLHQTSTEVAALMDRLRANIDFLGDRR